jgi:acetyl esterase/lipase
MASIRARIHRCLLSHTNLFDLEIPALRRKLASLSKRAQPQRQVSVNRVVVGQVPCVELVPPRAHPGTTLFYLHGGGGCLGLLPMTVAFVSRLAHACHLRALIPEYRIAPEHPFPAALDDASAVLAALAESSSERLILAGDSFGFGLGLAALQTGPSDWRRRCDLALALCPLVDLTGASETFTSRRAADPYRTRDPLRLARLYAGDHDPRSPRLSPLFGSLQGMPRLYVQAAEDDVFLGDAMTLAAAAERAGVVTTLRVFPRLWHVFQLSAGSLPEADGALREMVEVIASPSSPH